jgi:hypothetical protein
MKKANVYKDKTGWWVAEDDTTYERIGGFHDSELEAYKSTNAAGCIVI